MAASPSEIAPLFNFQEERILAGREGRKEGEGGDCRVLHLRPFNAVPISPRIESVYACYDVGAAAALSVMIQKAVERGGRRRRPRPAGHC